jgi:hypothetical protein
MWADEERDRDREAAEVYALLRHLDHPAPRIDAEAIAVRARKGGLRWPPWAAGVFLALGAAGVAYAAPGSPLRAWTKAVLGWVDGPPTAPGPAAPIQAPDPVASGISVVPGRELTIVFTASPAAAEARVSLTDGTEVVVRALGGPATFTSDVDRLVIDNQGSPADFEIQIPRAAPRIEIRVGTEPILRKEGARIRAERAIEAGQSYRLPLAP